MFRPVMIVLWVFVLGARGSTPTEASPVPPAHGKTSPQAAETTAWNAAKPVLEKYCAGCHRQGGKAVTKRKLGYFDMTSYPPSGRHAKTIGVTVANVLGLSGRKPRMPLDKPGAVAGDELALVKAWTDAWAAAEAAGAHGAATSAP